MKKLRLNDLSKKELIWMVKRVAYSADPLNREYHIDRALNDLQYEREKKNLAEAERISTLCFEKRMAAVELLAPYDGKGLADIPFEIAEKVSDLMSEARALDNRWNKLSGIMEDI